MMNEKQRNKRGAQRPAQQRGAKRPAAERPAATRGGLRGSASVDERVATFVAQARVVVDEELARIPQVSCERVLRSARQTRRQGLFARLYGAYRAAWRFGAAADMRLQSAMAMALMVVAIAGVVTWALFGPLAQSALDIIDSQLLLTSSQFSADTLYGFEIVVDSLQ